MDTHIPRGCGAVLFLALVIVVIGGIAASQKEDSNLTALKAEDVATFTLVGGSLVLDNEAGAHTSLGKPYNAQAFRVFAFDDRERAVHGRDSVIRLALDSGWRLHRQPESRFDLVSGAKTLTTGPAMLTIGTYQDDGVDKVSIYLEDRQCPEAICPPSP